MIKVRLGACVYKLIISFFLNADGEYCLHPAFTDEVTNALDTK